MEVIRMIFVVVVQICQTIKVARKSENFEFCLVIM